MKEGHIMGSYIKTYMRSVDKALEDENTDFAALKREHLVQIEFIQHGRSGRKHGRCYGH